jgi:hypothetical protein
MDVFFRFFLALYVISFWPQLTWRHAVWAAVIAILTFPLKKLWDWWADRFWQAFKLSFMASFKQSESGKQFMKAFYESRAKRDAEAIKAHPELKDMLTCKVCSGSGMANVGNYAADLGLCENCGGTGLV